MNILFICDEYPPGRNGGIGTVVQILGRELVNQGHSVFVAGLYAHSYGQQNYEEDQGVKVWRFRYGWPLSKNPDSFVNKAFNKIPGLIKQHLNGKKAFNRFIDFIHNLIKTENVQIIEIPDWNTFAMRIGFTVKWPKFSVPLVVKSHGSYTKICYDLGQEPKARLRKIDQLLYERADALTAVSNSTAETNKLLFQPNKDIKTIYNGINIPVYKTKGIKKDGKVVFTGTLIAAKGIYQLMKAWNLVHKDHPNATLEVYGKGNTSALIKMLEPAALPSVHFKGHVSRAELFDALSEATMAVFPSFSESFALAPMEAMAVGCPIVYTSHSSGKELIDDGENGVLVDPNNVEKIAEKIKNILKNKQLQEKYSVNGKKTIENKFHISHIAKTHIDYYQTLISTLSSDDITAASKSNTVHK